MIKAQLSVQHHDNEPFPVPVSAVLSLRYTTPAMAFTNKPHVSLTMDQILSIVDQLSPEDTLKVAERIKARNKNADLDDLIAIFSKVRIGEEELTSIVEEERAKLYAREKARHGRH